MYELQNLNQSIIKSYFKAIEKAYKKDNWYAIILVSLKQTYHKLYPEVPFYILEASIKRELQPIIDSKKYNITTRDFIDDDEAKEVYHSTYDELIKELVDSKDSTDHYNLELIDLIYDLLPYDQVTLINNKKYLSSFVNLNYWGDKHLNAYLKWEELHYAKPAEKNIDTANNTQSVYQDKVKFMNDILEPDITHPHIDSSESEIQLEFLKYYGEYHCLMARSIYMCSKILDIEYNQELFAIGKLAPRINSDKTIVKQEIFISWYAYVIRIFQKISKKSIPLKSSIELARLSSYVLFPQLQKGNKSLISIETAKKQIRERALFSNLRLYDFSDNRYKIKKSKEEIQFTEEYLSEISRQLRQLT